MSLDQVERLVTELEALPDPRARATARAVVAAVLELHGAGLARLVELVRATGEPGRACIESAARDPAVASLLLLHGLHPVDLPTRVAGALAGVPGAELIAIDEGAEAKVHVRARAASVRAVEARLLEAAPDATVSVESDGGDAFVPLARLQTGGR